MIRKREEAMAQEAVALAAAERVAEAARLEAERLEMAWLGVQEAAEEVPEENEVIDFNPHLFEEVFNPRFEHRGKFQEYQGDKKLSAAGCINYEKIPAKMNMLKQRERDQEMKTTGNEQNYWHNDR